MNKNLLDAHEENIALISCHPVKEEIEIREEKWKIKSILLEKAKKNGYKCDYKLYCSRTFGFQISSGSPNLFHWCHCTKECFRNWSKEWIYYQKIHWNNLSNFQQVAFIEQHVVRGENGHTYYLPSSGGRISVCQSFFKKVLGMGSCKLNRILQYGNKSPTNSINNNNKVGKWSRETIHFKGKINNFKWKQWIESQAKSLSHFTRNKTRNQLWYFTQVTSFRELYRKYKMEMIQQEQNYMSSTSFFYKMKEHYPNFKFHSPILDACSTCLQLIQIHEKATSTSDKLVVMKLLHKHQDEADGRYSKWRKDRSLVSASLSTQEIEVIIHSKQHPYIHFYLLYYLRP